MAQAMSNKRRNRVTAPAPDPHRELAHHGDALRRTRDLLGELVVLLAAPPEPHESWLLVNELTKSISSEFDTMWRCGYDHYEKAYNVTPDKLSNLNSEVITARMQLQALQDRYQTLKLAVLEQRMTTPILSNIQVKEP